MTSATPSSDDDAAVTTPFNYNLLLSVLGPARIDFLQHCKKPGTHDKYSAFRQWLLVQVETKAGEIEPAENASREGPPYSESAVTVFDLLVRGEELKSEKPVSQTLSSKKILFDLTRARRMIDQAYKWTARLCLVDPNCRRMDNRAFHMWSECSRKFGTKTNFENEVFWNLPMNARKYLQDQYFTTTNISTTNNPTLRSRLTFNLPPNAFDVFLYIWFIYVALHKKIVQKSKRKRDLITTEVYSRMSYIVQRVSHAWSSFAQFLGFEDIDCMVYPYFYLDTTTTRFKIRERHNFQFESNRFGLTLSPDMPQGVSRGHENAPQPFASLPEEVDDLLRSFSTAFFNDLHDLATNMSLFSMSEDEFLAMHNLQKFDQSAHSAYAPRFQYSTATLDCVRKTVNSVRVSMAERSLSHSVLHRPSTAQSEITVRTSKPSSPISRQGSPGEHHCDATCDDMKQKLLRHMSKTCVTFECAHTELLQALDEEMDRECIRGKVQLILTDPPYGIRSAAGKSNSSHDTISSDEMKQAVEVMHDLLRPGGHVILFCAIQQFNQWRELFVDKTDDDTQLRAFKVSKTPLVFVPKEDAYRHQVYRKNLTHQNITEFALHAVRNPAGNVSYNQALKMVSWSPQGYITTTFPPFTNVTNNVPALSVKETVQLHPDQDSRAMLRPEQKSVLLCKELISRYSKPKDIVVDLFAGTFSTAVAAMTLPAPRIFFGCDIDGNCVDRGEQRCLQAFIDVLLQPERALHTPIIVDDSIQSAAQTYRDLHFRTERFDPRATSLPPPEGFPLCQMLPAFLTNFLASVTNDRRFADPKTRASLPNIGQAICSAFYKLLLFVPCVRQRPPSSFCSANPIHPFSRCARFTVQTPSGCITAWSCTVTSKKDRIKSYGNGHYTCSTEQFKNQAVQVLKENTVAKKKGVVVSSVYIVPAPFCALSTVRTSNFASECNAEFVSSPHQR